MIEIVDGIFISEDELVFKVSRSSGPGGQNVNKVNTRVTLLFDLANCKSFSDEQKQRMLKRLAKRVDKAGTLRVVSQKYRTQRANRKAAIERLRQLLLEGLKKPPVRRRTKMPLAAKQKRLENKRHRSLLKQRRAKRISSEDLTY
jgi:ribosome-associated protein